MPSIRFDCPACGVTLTVPGAASGLQGPCPKCWQEIVSPDIARGLPARLPHLPPVAPPPPPAQEAPAPPPVPPAPVAEAPVIPAPFPEPPAAAPSAQTPKSSWVGPVLLSTLGSAIVFSAAGYWLGNSRHSPAVEPLNFPSPAKGPEIPPTPVAPDPVPEPAPEPVPPTPPPAATPEKITADVALKSFLDAPDWKTRAQFVVLPDEVRDEMEKHAKEAGDGPIKTTAVAPTKPAPGAQIYMLSTAEIPEGFPVAVMDTEQGPKVNWSSFVGFHDDYFRKFYEGPAGVSSTFDLLIKPEAVAPGDEGALFAWYLVQPPMPNRQQRVCISKNSVSFAKLKSLFEGNAGLDKTRVDQMVAETGIPVMLSLAKKETNDKRTYLEIEELVAISW